MIKSKKKSRRQCCKCLLRNQACRYFGIVYQEPADSMHPNGEENHINDNTVSTLDSIYHIDALANSDINDADPHSTKFWGYFNSSLGEFPELDLQTHLHTYWKRRFGQTNSIPEKHNLPTNIIVGKRMFFNGTVYNSLEHKPTTRKLCHFVKLSVQSTSMQKEVPNPMQFGKFILVKCFFSLQPNL